MVQVSTSKEVSESEAKYICSALSGHGVVWPDQVYSMGWAKAATWTTGSCPFSEQAKVKQNMAFYSTTGTCT